MLINHKWKTMNHKKVMLQSIAGPYSLEMVLEFKYSDYTLFFITIKYIISKVPLTTWT